RAAARGGPQLRLVGRPEPHERRHVLDPSLDDGGGLAARPQLAREERHELPRARHAERPLVAAALPHLPQHRQDRERPECRRRLTAHARRRPTRRRWIDWRIPIARKFVIIDEPPTETNGNGMPVIGAIPIVIAAFTNTWNRNMNAIAPATTAQ